ncbi:MAG: hydantoinase/oxoprolinase family protein, partial [Gemmatimonadota bacterium]
MNPILGWDIGGVNVKVAAVTGPMSPPHARSAPFELQRDPAALAALLRSLADELSGGEVTHAVTMTAELSQMFRTKANGVAFVLDQVEAAFPGARICVFTVDGRFVPPAAARLEPLAVAASNWAATARIVAREAGDAILVDIGTTTTDIIPIVGGRVAAIGLTDPARLASGELVYTG